MASQNTKAARAAILSLRGLRRRRFGETRSVQWEQAAAEAAAAFASSSPKVPSLIGGAQHGSRPRAAKNLINGAPRRNANTLLNGTNGAANTVNGNGANGNGANGVNGNGAARKSLIPGLKLPPAQPAPQQRGLAVNGAASITVTDPAPPPNNNEQDKIKDSPFESDLIVVLDMDECLIHSQFLSSNDRYRQHESGRPNAFSPYAHDEESSSIVPTSVESFRMSLPDGDLVHVNKRPNLDLFLKEISKKYETHVFTAAMKVYAKPLLDVLDPKGKMIQRRFYRECCKLNNELGVYVKDLEHMFDHGQQQQQEDEEEKDDDDEAEESLLGRLSPYNEKRVVLVDNNPLSFLANPSNGILVSNFYDDPKDDTLFAVSELLSELEGEEDVRPVLDDRFGLHDALKDVQRHGGLWR